ncbi:GGDEF domain-containing protein [Desulfurella sp.]|uniref:GGDEF domain-containing protein n=1 Tax=Desulfurella sp. TaxID=1962857 RepID=UPI0025C19C39|nr:GGDEF domain-containing protein [Desulfurella sp.]
MQNQVDNYVQFLSRICSEIEKRHANLNQYYAMVDNLIDMAYKDHLTKLYNRRYFEDALNKEICRFERYGHIFSLCMLDIDGFKQINDTYGHLKGDEVLKRFATFLTNNSRTSDIICRWGGDEFAVILPHTSFNKIEAYIKKFVCALKTQTDSLLIHATIGATSIRLNDNKESLIERADEALYIAKKEKKTYYVI